MVEGTGRTGCTRAAAAPGLPAASGCEQRTRCRKTTLMIVTNDDYADDEQVNNKSNFDGHVE